MATINHHVKTDNVSLYQGNSGGGLLYSALGFGSVLSTGSSTNILTKDDLIPNLKNAKYGKYFISIKLKRKFKFKYNFPMYVE